MSIKSLFNNKTKTVDSALSGSTEVESRDFVLTSIKRDETFQPFIDFATASNFAKFGSAEEYYKNSIERIHNEYPYDGSENEKLEFELSSSYLDKYILDNRYPKTNGYINMSYGGWGTQQSIADGFGLSDSNEYIFMRGGIHTPDENLSDDVRKWFDKSIVYNEEEQRVSSLKMDLSKGITTEFWLKKDSFDLGRTEKEVILDLWNGEASSSVNYGRFTLALSGTANGEDTFIVTMQSGTTGFYEESIGTATVTTSSLSSWHHYALSFVSASSEITGRLYVDGDLNESKSLGTSGINEIGGLINGYIGALQTSPSGSSAVQYSGKLSASLDDFRFWKTRRTSEQIYNNWYRHVGGGTNTDDANIYLGVYYKFNEGIVGNTSTDSVILDYSGRLVNGSWFGYTSGARSTDSAFVESGLLTSEAKDYIIYSSHPDVISLKEELIDSGSAHDKENPALLYNKVPQWIRDEDASTGDTTKKLYQIIASYFDTLHIQIEVLPHLKNKVYNESSYKPLPFADRLLEEKGLLVANLFADSDVLEAFGQRDLNQIQFEERIADIKNQIYTNIYNNLEQIYKHKGTEGAIRNMLRCFGIDDELVKLNIYTDKGTHYFTDSFKHTSLNKKYIDFNKQYNVGASIFQTSSANHSLTYVSGSEAEKLEQYNAISSEISIIVPKKAELFDKGYFNTTFQSASIFGMHSALPDSSDYTWGADDANFQVFLVRDELNSSNARFILKDYDGNITLESPVYKQIYSNESWNLSVRVKPEDYPIAGNVVTSSNRDYVLEFYGVNHSFDTIKNEFLLTQSLNFETGSAFLSEAKRFYVGAHRVNFTGSVLEYTDIKAGRFNLWYDYVGNEEVKLHNRDITSKGNKRTARPSTIFTKDLEGYEIPTYELLAADWDFELVSTTDGSGEFITVDASSGSTDTRYGWIDNIVRREHRAKGVGFPASTNVVSNEIVYSSKKELPEISYSADGVVIKGEREEYFIKDEDVSDNFYALEKSMYQTISEEMMRTLSTAQEMSNLMGEAVERYRLEYKKLNYVRRMFFEDVEEDPDFDRFTEYFKWIDSSMSYMVSQMFPASVRFSKGIADVVESHLFERNKYQNKFPLISTHTATEGRISGVGQSKYRWEFGHAPFERIAKVDAEINFDVDGASLIDGGAFLEITGGATQVLIESTTNETINASSDIIVESKRRAFRATNNNTGIASDVTYSGLSDQDFSVSFWFNNGDADTTNSAGINFNGGPTGLVTLVSIGLDDDINILYRDSNNTVNDTAFFNTNLQSVLGGQWVHVHISLERANLATAVPRVWLNGTEVSSTGFSPIGGTSGNVSKIYLYLDDYCAFQDVVIWDHAITDQGAIDESYNSGNWFDPSTHTSASNIVDWYKMGDEEYWYEGGVKLGDNLTAFNTVTKYLSSSYGTGLNDLTISTIHDQNITMTTGVGYRTNTEMWNRLSSSLSSSFPAFSVSYQDNGTYGSFKLVQNIPSAITIDITETGNDFSNTSTVDYVPFSIQADPNVNCLWRKEREERADIPERETIRQIIGNRNNAPGTVVSGSSGTYTNSNYGVRRFSKPLDMNVVISQTFHPGTNYKLQKDREYIWSATSRHSSLSPAGFPKNVLIVGAGEGQGIELPVECDDVESPNQKKKFNTKVYVGKHSNGTPGGSFTPIDDSDSYTYAVKGALKLPFNIFSGSITTGYNEKISSGYKSDAVVTNLHSDTTDFSNDLPLQGPFTSQWVGGHQARHIDLNRYDTTLIDGETLTAPPNNIHNLYTRPEAWRLLVVEAGGASDGALGMVDAQYGVTAISGHPNNGKYPDVAKKAATLYRDGRTKRAMNIANIQTTTSSVNHGNFTENYEIVSVAGGKKENNLFFRKNSETHDFLPSEIESILPQTTNYQTLVGVSNYSNGNVFGVGESNIINSKLSYEIISYDTEFSFTLDQVSNINHSSTLQITASSTDYIVEINDPNIPISNPTANLIMRTGSAGLALKGLGSSPYVGASGVSSVSSNSFSVSFWYYYNYATANTTIKLRIGTTDYHTIKMSNDVQVVYKNSVGATSTATFDTNFSSRDKGWYHIVITFSLADLTRDEPGCWINGSSIAKTSAFTPVGGTAPSINNLYFDITNSNTIQDLCFWNIILGTSNAVSLYNYGFWINPKSMSFASNLMDWYKMGYEFSGYSVNDYLSDLSSAPYYFVSYGTIYNNKLTVNQPTKLQFIEGNNPFGTTKTDIEFWDELRDSLYSVFHPPFSVSRINGDFTLFSNSPAEKSPLTILETGSDFSLLASSSTPIIDYEFGYLNTTTIATESVTRTVISSRFSAPGSIDTMTYGFLDAYSQEYSVYNNLNYRNLSVRGIDVRVSSSADGTDYYNFGGSGEAGTIRAANHLDQRDGLKALLSRHMGKFGVDARYAAELNDEPLLTGSYNQNPAYHGQHRNTNRRPADSSTLLAPVLLERHDNMYVSSLIPRSDFQYKWVTSSLGDNYSITSGKQRMYGYAHPTGILSSSVEIDGDSGFVPAITFPTASEIFGE